ncbi:MAG: carbamoyl-phosphate synthase (glutamine-hydrolyzing) large subunit [Candidatus Aenigmarchaeota archaeon]|nr:carbamoyl-phosphate synthase (glutamine-hydrolyzing) large subunit [Candidatus Aenigmarchaeota archaeon]
MKKVLIIGSGAIKIGEAGEFDYSGSQAIKALKEEGIETVLVNPNIATVQTDPGFAGKVYSIPITPAFVEKVIAKELPDGILLGFGGQTALNCGMELHETGILEKYGVVVLGTGPESIKLASDREKFRSLMEQNNVPVPRSMEANSVTDALKAAKEIGYPVIVRVAYTLGGYGSGVAHNDAELKEISYRGLSYSRIRQILVEEYLDGWKELEYEVMRDRDDNCIIICNMENFDPMGVHTGDSIVVAPSQTLNDEEYHMLRTTALKVVRALGIVGECNIQYALDPRSHTFKVIEVNSRLSRSSALASKATGYPIAYIAAKLSLGHRLHELKNKMTATSACFEPALDYVVVKMPRWDFQKFKDIDPTIGTQMKSVGEVMAIGTRFEEALQKAVRMLDVGKELTYMNGEADISMLETPNDRRVFHIANALRSMSVEQVAFLTKIDSWFISKIKNIVDAEKSISMTKDAIFRAKRLGFSDKRIASLMDSKEDEIRSLRKEMGIVPAVRQIDTTAAEWEARTNYLYLTYGGTEDDILFKEKKKIIVLGSGCYRIGSSVEFDWCCVNTAQAMKKYADEVIMINYNPETVSTDYDIIDKLYFDELTLERVLDIADKENPLGIVVSVGGQIPNNLATALAKYGMNIIGTKAENIDRAEDRVKFSSLLDSIGIQQPQWTMLKSAADAKNFAKHVGYPVLIRPSYVLSGSSMNVAFSDEQLSDFMKLVPDDSSIAISKFLLKAKEVEVDGVRGDKTFVAAILEHIEDAGVHSGDATMMLPALNVSQDEKNNLIRITEKIADALDIKGPFNMQYLLKKGGIYVIECNLRASRSMPFVSKTIGKNMMEIAARAMMENKVTEVYTEPTIYGVKFPQFSFTRLGADPVTGVEMVSTGEVACFGASFEEAFLKSATAGGIRIPKDGSIFITVGGDKTKIEEPTRMLSQKFRIYATEDTARFLSSKGIKCETLYKVNEDKQPNLLDYLIGKKLDMVVNIPSLSSNVVQTIQDEQLIRKKSVEFGVPVITNMELFRTMANALSKNNIEELVKV